jgi:hypothetical protein
VGRLEGGTRAVSVDYGELELLLNLVADHVDLDHCREVDERYQRALAYEAVDRPPLVVQADFGAELGLPEPWNRFKRYSYRESFENPAAMLQNQILSRVVSGQILKDDNPLAIRADHGTIQIGSVLGGQWMLHEDNFPWIATVDNIEIIADGDQLHLEKSVLPRSLETLVFYREKLKEHPPCAEAIQISMPDLQGPMDTGDLLWGSKIFFSFRDNPDVLKKLVGRIVETMLDIAARFRPYTRDHLDPVANTQHGYMIPGRLLIRNDSSIMLSPEMYAEFLRPHDARVLKEIGTGSIHFCGNGQHLIKRMLEIPDLRGFDLGQPNLMDVEAIYASCKECKVAVTNLSPSRDDLISGKAGDDFPTGAAFVYLTKNMADAAEVVQRYKRCAN